MAQPPLLAFSLTLSCLQTSLDPAFRASHLHTTALSFLPLECPPACIHHNPILTVEAHLPAVNLSPVSPTRCDFLLPPLNFIWTSLLELIWPPLPFRSVCCGSDFLLECGFFKTWGCSFVTFSTSEWHHTMLCVLQWKRPWMRSCFSESFESNPQLYLSFLTIWKHQSFIVNIVHVSHCVLDNLDQKSPKLKVRIFHLNTDSQIPLEYWRVQ